ncbi:hypothetical protein MD535_25285 [Vibrio sp. ZSDZ65]|nr:hypothetical protein [Vibrio qingdaonensis]MCW8349299.1 hypothetical protein [Vibrio qingdaonensis]
MTYQFVLPAYVKGVSEIVGSIQKRKLEMIQPNQYSMQLDESATKAFADAL